MRENDLSIAKGSPKRTRREMLNIGVKSVVGGIARSLFGNPTPTPQPTPTEGEPIRIRTQPRGTNGESIFTPKEKEYTFIEYLSRDEFLTQFPLDVLIDTMSPDPRVALIHAEFRPSGYYGITINVNPPNPDHKKYSLFVHAEGYNSGIDAEIQNKDNQSYTVGDPLFYLEIDFEGQQYAGWTSSGTESPEFIDENSDREYTREQIKDIISGLINKIDIFTHRTRKTRDTSRGR